jgi:ribosomal protein S18 acetylase RimI-like enzyme
MQQISITYDDALITSENLANLLEHAGFGSASIYLSLTDFRLSFLCPGTTSVFSWEHTDNHLVGLARVFTDNLFTTYISEVCVHPMYQKKGIGSGLVMAITKRFSHTAIFADAFRDHVSIFTKNEIHPTIILGRRHTEPADADALER